MAKITPMMQQYFEIKEQYKHCLLFFRLGDFYEMFFEDAVIASKELEITLTGKDWGQEERAPMCGVPFHSADGYIARLVERGYKVAICEQVEDPKTAKGLVKRDVVRVITPGTVVDNTVLDETKNNYILSVFSSANGYGIAVCDVTTGEFQTTEFRSVQAAAKILDETARFSPAELVCNSEFLSTPLAKEIEERFHLYLNDIDSRMYEYNTAKDTLLAHFKVKTLESFGLQKKLLAVSASGALMWYLNETQKNDLSHISALKYYTTGDFMLLDVSSRRNLELTETMREKNKKGSLLSVLDKTQTAMGARLLRKWVEQPLLSKEEINQRLDGVEELFQDLFLREEIKEILHSMYDFERIMSRVVYQNANARDLAALKNSVENLPLLKKILSRCRSPYLSTLHDRLDTLENIHALIAQSIVEDPPFSVREGGMIREGFNEELDTYTKAKENGTTWIHQLEEEEREKTGIKNLKVRYNKVFGYYIEVTKSNLELVPEGYIRKQTLANAERFITPELKELEELILGAVVVGVQAQHAALQLVHNIGRGGVHGVHKTVRQGAGFCQDLAEIVQLLPGGQATEQKQPDHFLKHEAVVAVSLVHDLVDVDAPVDQLAGGGDHMTLLILFVAHNVTDVGQTGQHAGAIRVAQAALDPQPLAGLRVDVVVCDVLLAQGTHGRRVQRCHFCVCKVHRSAPFRLLLLILSDPVHPTL